MRPLTTLLAVVGALACWYFVGAYWWLTRGDWWHSAAGRHLLVFTGNLGLLLSWIVAIRLWHVPGTDVITLLLFAALVAQIVWRSVLLHRAQHQRNRTTHRL